MKEMDGVQKQFVPRPEYPRPDFARELWMTLNGEWEFEFDERPQPGQDYSRKIMVPFVYQTKASGIGEEAAHNRIFYRKSFQVMPEFAGKRTFLHFGAVDYQTKVLLNGETLGEHTGGYTPFAFEITDVLKSEDNVLEVWVTDMPDTAQPRGKQYWKEVPDRCWYTPTSGIWQSVWIEAVEGKAIESFQITPDIDNACIELELKAEECTGDTTVRAEIFYKGEKVQLAEFSLGARRRRLTISLLEADAIDEVHFWSPEHPNLYDIRLTLCMGGRIQDVVTGYFGMRRIACENGRILLNHYPYYLKMVLDQGYWEESGLTAPTDEALRRDVELCLEYGFNGARKHQKIEDPRYYYWCDRLGLLVWGEIPSGYEFCGDEIENITRDLQEFIKRDYNHPSVIAWVPLNESWGVRKMKVDQRQQHFGESLYYLLKSLDPMRLVSTNDGWENVTGDIAGIHDYAQEGDAIRKKYNSGRLEDLEGFYPGHRKLLAQGYHRGDMALMITEYGGIALKKDAVEGAWGYAEAEATIDSLVERYRDVTEAIGEIKEICGFCYTQLTDVYQEVNGLLNFDHSVKVPSERIREINRRI